MYFRIFNIRIFLIDTMETDNSLNLIYEKLLNSYSYQGWWPLINYNGSNPTKTGAIFGYHPKKYDFPRNEEEQFEIIMGSILTQNTSWTSVEKALKNLHDLIDFSPKKLLNLVDNDKKSFIEAIRCAGFVNQKSTYLQNIAKFYLKLEGEIPSRNDLLDVKGIGNETADSILLFAYKQKEFKVDTYTKRIFSNLGFINQKDSYLSVKYFFENNFDGDVDMFQEYHALIVEHAKRFYSKKPYGIDDKLLIEFKN